MCFIQKKTSSRYACLITKYSEKSRLTITFFQTPITRSIDTLRTRIFTMISKSILWTSSLRERERFHFDEHISMENLLVVESNCWVYVWRRGIFRWTRLGCIARKRQNICIRSKNAHRVINVFVRFNTHSHTVYFIKFSQILPIGQP